MSARLIHVLRACLIGGAALFILVYVAVASVHLRHPYELEWMEGGSVDHVQRVLDGEALYVAPTVDFVPFIYTPLYYYVAAGVSGIVGEGFLPLRLVSLLASLGCFGVLFALVRRASHSAFAGLLAAGLFAATFRAGGAWFDIGRSDSLFLFLALLGLYVARFGQTWQASVFAGLLFFLSFLTKQTGLAIAIAVGVGSLALVGWRRAALLIGTCVAGVVVSTLVFNGTSAGWYGYYVFEIPNQHEYVSRQIVDFWRVDVLGVLPIAFALAVYGLVRELGSSRKTGLFYVLSLGGMVGAAYLSRLHSGGYANVLIPAYAAIAVLFGLGLHRLLGEIASAWNGGSLAPALLYVFAMAQFAMLVYNPRALVPSDMERQVGDELVRQLKEYDGEIWLPAHGYVAAQAGKRSHAHIMAILDVIRATGGPAREKLVESITRALREQRFTAIVHSTGVDIRGFDDAFDEHYRKRDVHVFAGYEGPFQVTGAPHRPDAIYESVDK